MQVYRDQNFHLLFAEDFPLFIEASIEHTHCIMHDLDFFKGYSQKNNI